MKARQSNITASQWRWGLFAGCLLVLAYLPLWHCGFIWDDDQYVINNATLRDWAGLWQIWFHPSATPQYYPLVHASFWLEYHWWGLAPLGYHLDNLLLHGLAAWLFFRCLRCLRVPGAWLAAAIFALHPVEVESVAWVTERKNVLSAVFYFASALAWWRFQPLSESVGKKQWRWYCAALLLFAAALLSKTVTASLPVALLLVCWWKRGKVTWTDVKPLLPFFLVGAALGLGTAWIEKHQVGAEGAGFALTFAQRVLIAGRALWFYAEKLLWPVRLTFIYPRWDAAAGAWWQWLFPAAAVAALALLWVRRAQWGRGPLAAVLLFAVTLGPALGFINFYPMRFSFVADHFQYLAATGLIILFAAWASRWPNWTSVVLLTALAALTFQQARMYRDVETLWRTTVERNPNAWIAQTKLGVILLGQGKTAEAKEHFQTVLRAQPNTIDAVDPLCNLGLIAFQNGQMDEASADFQKALQILPTYDVAENGLGSVFLRQGRADVAAAHFKQALDYNPVNMNASLNLGLAWSSQGRTDDAVAQFERCLRLQPDNAPAHANLGALDLKMGRVGEAIAHYQAALAIQPDNPGLLNDLAWIRAASAQPQFRNGAEAVPLAERACQLTGFQLPVTLNTLAAAYAEAGRFDEAATTAEKARQLVLASGQKEAADKIQETIQLFKSHQAYHEAAGQGK